jgi:hypothetical protein
MASNAFQVDWGFVDTVIIILLFLLLLGVKIFKLTHRWRLSFSNEDLEYYSFPKPYNLGNSHYIKTEHCSLTRNLSLYKYYNNYPLILVLRTKFKKHLAKIITESLSSYGFNVLNLKLDIKLDSSSNSLNKTNHEEIKSLFSSILEKFKHEGLIVNSKYILLHLSKHFIPNTETLSDPKKKGFILINPRMNKYNIRSLKENLQNLPQYTQIFYIFSKKNYFILKNNDLKRFIKEFDENSTNKSNLITLEKSTKSFRYYETILLGIIIDIIENKLMKSANNT